MRELNILKLSHSKSVYVESIKTIRLHVISEIGVWINCTKKDYSSYEPCQELSQHWEMTKCVMVQAYSFMKRKDEKINGFIIKLFLLNL